MTTSLRMRRHRFATGLLATIITVLIFSSCTKPNDQNVPIGPVSFQSSEVLDKWITMQLRLMKNTTGVPNQAFSRFYAYSGITAIESLAPGIPGYYNAYRKWNGLTGLLAQGNSMQYYFPANINAAMAAINRTLFPNATAADKQAIDSLEAALKAQFLLSQPAAKVTRSVDFGKAVAAAVYAWSETDGYKSANSAYTP